MAEQRLAVNSNDIAGLVIKTEYDVMNLNFIGLSNSINSVLSIESRVNMTNFNTHFKSLKSDLTWVLELIPKYPPEEIEGDRKKALNIHKPMNFDYILKALDDDGYFDKMNETTDP